MASPQCPLGRQAFLVNLRQQMRLQHIQKIEEHVGDIAASNSNCHHPPLKDIVFNDFIKGSTPLLLACYNGYLPSVERIVEHWKVDVNLAATYYIEPLNNKSLSRKIDIATPLFVAASRGHADVVRFLLQNGANVSTRTSDQDEPLYNGLTPLYGALCDDECYFPKYRSLSQKREKRTDIVHLLLESGADVSMEAISRPFDEKPMWMGTRWCGIEAITALIDHGMDLNPQAPNELTLLNHWAGRPTTEEESLAVVKLLVERGANVNSMDGSDFSPITNAAHRQNLAALDFLLEREDVCRMDKIDALELAGAVILSDTKHAALFLKAFGYWRRSLQLRLEDTEGCGPIVKTPKNPGTGRLLEWTTSEDLDRVIQHPSEQEIQSFLVRLRILSTKSWKDIQSLFESYLYSSTILSQLEEQGRFVDLFNIAWSMLESIRDDFDALEEGLWSTTLEVIRSLNNALVKLGDRKDPFLTVKIIEKSLELILATDQFHLNNRESVYDIELYVHMDSMILLIDLLADLPQMINEENIIEPLSELVRRDQRRHPLNGSLLHMACHEEKLATVDLLLRAGADPNAGDYKGNGPLHVVANWYYDQEIYDAIARLLLEKGSHLDRVNDEGKTAADVWIKNHAHYGGRKRRRSGDQEADPKIDLPSWLRPDDSVPKLKCECARVIRSNGVPYKHLLLPSLHGFVSWH